MYKENCENCRWFKGSKKAVRHIGYAWIDAGGGSSKYDEDFDGGGEMQRESADGHCQNAPPTQYGFPGVNKDEFCGKFKSRI